MAELPEYLAFFGLRENPFAPTADPAYFYATREHKECLFRLWNSIDERHGIAVVLGNYGTGKTTLLRKLMTGMRAEPHRYVTAVLGSPIPSWTSFALLEGIVHQFNVQPAERSFVAYMEALNQHLLANRSRVCTLIIDDAQNLNKRGQLELLRLVQNLETQQHKLLNLVLFAQLEWMPVLQAAANFAQRVNLTYTLKPMSLEETQSFIEYRIEQASAGPGEGPHFDALAMKAIHEFAGGMPRVVVTICRNALLVAAQIQTRTIGHEIIFHTVEKTMPDDAEKREDVMARVLGVPRPRRSAPAPSAPSPAPEATPAPAPQTAPAPTPRNPSAAVETYRPAPAPRAAAPSPTPTPSSPGRVRIETAGSATRDNLTREQRAAQILLRGARGGEKDSS